jgi:acyl-coenzyme A thioesterase PaaI-like protein
VSSPTTENASTPPFYTRYGFSRPGESASEFAIEPYLEICVDGALRATVIASAIDLVGGFHTREIAGTDATFTADLSLRIPAPGIPTRLIAQGQRLRAGRRLVSTNVTIETDGSPYAFGTTTFSRISRAPEDAPDIASLSTPLILPQWPLDRPLDQEVGIETIDAPKGIVRLPLRTELLNPEGIMQGALVALVVECAGLALANATLPGQQVVTELDLRYLAANSSGPIESRAAFIGDPTNRMIRIELHDVGKGDRLTTAALLRVADAPL